MNKLNIAVFCDTSPHEINGVSTSVQTKIDVLKANGHNVYLFTTGKKTVIDLENHIIQIHGYKLKKIYGYRMVIPCHKKIMKLCKELKIDLIHADTEYGVGIIGFRAAKKFNIPLVYTYHTKIENYTYYIFKDHFKKLINKLVRKATEKYVDNATKVIVPGFDTKDYLESIGAKNEITILPTGIDKNKFLEAYQRRDKIRNDIFEKLRIPRDYKLALCLGRVGREKGFDFAVARFLNYKKSYPNSKVKLLFVGEGPYLKEIQKTSKRMDINGDILFLGKISYENVPCIYAAADVYLNSSTTETQGLTYMEAMASRLIILTRNADFLRNVIVHNESGFYFDSQKEFNELFEKILYIDESEGNRIRDNALEVCKRYSLENFYDGLMEVYMNALKKDETKKL